MKWEREGPQIQEEECEQHQAKFDYNNQMRKRQQLQEYLDAQLQRLQTGQPAKTFDQLEEKLAQIERKLLSLKVDPLPLSSHYSPQRTKKESRKKKELASQSQTKFQRHGEWNQQLKKVQQQAQITPQKHFNIFSKIMSEGHFCTTPTNNLMASKAKKKMKKSSSNKTYKNQLGINEKINIVSMNSTDKKQTKTLNNNKKSSQKIMRQRHSSQKYLNKSTYDSNLIQHLQKDINLCMKSNSQLKTKVNQLQGYKNQYCKFRQLFDKFQRQRKRQRHD